MPLSSRCVLLYHPTDYGKALNVLTFKEGGFRSKMTEAMTDSLNEVYDFAQNFQDCRQLAILKAAGSTVSPGFACRHCDVCLGMYPATYDVTAETKELLRWIYVQSNHHANADQGVRLVDVRDQLAIFLQQSETFPLQLNTELRSTMIEEWVLALRQGEYVSKVPKTGSLKPGRPVCVASRSILPPWRSIRFRLALRTYAPWGVRVVSQTKSRKIPTRNILPLFFASRSTPASWCAPCSRASRSTAQRAG